MVPLSQRVVKNLIVTIDKSHQRLHVVRDSMLISNSLCRCFYPQPFFYRCTYFYPSTPASCPSAPLFTPNVLRWCIKHVIWPTPGLFVPNSWSESHLVSGVLNCAVFSCAVFWKTSFPQNAWTSHLAGKNFSTIFCTIHYGFYDSIEVLSSY